VPMDGVAWALAEHHEHVGVRSRQISPHVAELGGQVALAVCLMHGRVCAWLEDHPQDPCP
jgi:hypothetical protein